MLTVLTILAIVLYLSCAALIALRIKGMVGGKAGISPKLLMWVWTGAVVIHGLTLYAHVVTPQGLNLGFFHALSAVAWLMAVLLLITALTRPLENLGVVLLPIAALSVGLEQMLPEIPFTAAAVAGGLELHIFVSLLAYSLLSLAALQALVLAMQNRHLHQHHPGGIIRALPPLQHMESLLFQLIALGFGLLSAALITGFMYLEDIFAQQQVHKTVFSIAAWLMFATLLWGHWQFGWRGRTAIRWTLGGFVFLMLAYFGSKLVLELLLQA